MTVAAELFTAEFALGFDALDPDLRVRLQGYLSDVVAARGFPLHTAVAWNALHFGFDPGAGSYDEALLGASMPTLELGRRGPAVPIGALAWVRLGGAQGDVWAEVVGKEGRPPGVEEGVAPAMLAGRPADRVDMPVPGGEDRHVVAVIAEALVCDFSPFGTLPGVDATLDRLARKGRLGTHRLVEVDAVYDPPDGAEDSDLWFYARWLWDSQRHLLRAGPLAASLNDPDDATLQAALVASLHTVDALLTSVPGVLRWGDYALLADWVDEIDWSPNLPLHGADLDHLLVSMADGRPGEACCTALAPRLEEIAGTVAPPLERPDAAQADPLAGVDYLRVVARTSRWLADRVDATDGVVEVRGTRRLLRVDDTWPWGGLWRSEPWGPGHPLAGVPAGEPLGLGWRGWAALAEYLEAPVADIETAVRAALAAGAGPGGQPPEPEEEEGGVEGRDDDLAASVVEHHLTLRQVDVDTGTLPLPDVFGWLADGAPVTVNLRHAGDIDTDQHCQTAKAAEAPRLEGLSWPIDFFGGIRLHAAAFGGGRALFVSSVPLPDAVVVDGVEYRFAFDPAVVGRACPEQELTLLGIAIASLARHGRVASDDTRRATGEQVCTYCFGPDAPTALLAAVTTALDGAVASRRLDRAGGEYVWSRPARRNPPRRTAPTGWETRTVERAAVRAHYVPGFLRWLPPGWQASEVALARYAADRAAGYVRGPETLPVGVTYVVGHERGRRRSAYTDALAGTVFSLDGRSPAPDEIEDLFDTWESE